MTEPFRLTNEGSPVYQKPNAEAFKPHSSATMLRQSIYDLLAAHKGEGVNLAAISQLTKIPYSKIYAAAKKLCLKGIIKRTEEPKFRIKKTGEKVSTGKIVKLSWVEPWAAKKGKGDRRNLW